jgi:hypothetical protein
MERSGTPNYGSRIVSMKGRKDWTWHGSAPPAQAGAAPGPTRRNLLNNSEKTGAICDVLYVDVLISFSGKVGSRY